MPAPRQRDLESDRKQLVAWLGAKLPDATDLSVSELVGPEASGFSNDTLLFDLEYQREGRREREPLVVRIQPTGYQVFPEYDLGLQYRTMETLAGTDVPVPRMRWLEEDSGVLGSPFYVMAQVRGRVPPDNPPYHAGGWMTEIAPAERAAVWWGGIECIAKIHRLDYRALGFGFLDKPELGDTPLDQHLAYYRDYLEWAARGLEQPTVEAALEWLQKHKPDGEPTALSWGDARIGNIIFDGTTPAAVLDWEMVGLGSPTMDLAWQIFLDKHHSLGIETARLEGFPGYGETIERYQQLSGHRVQHLHYYEAFAGFRFSVIMMRLAQQMVEYEVLDATAGRAFELNNTVTRLLAKTLDLPAPGAGSASFAP